MDWFTLSIIGMMLYGIQNFIYKVVAEKRYNTGLVLMASFITGAIFSGIALCFSFTAPDSYIPIFIFAAIQASFYLVSRHVKIESFKHIPAVVALPVSRVHFALTGLLGIIILKEPYTQNTIIGMLLFLAVILLLSSGNSKKDIKQANFRAGIILAIATAIFTTISEFMVKIAAISYDVTLFMFLSYIWLIIPSQLLNIRLSDKKDNKRSAIISGFAIGIFNYASFYTVMSALKVGPASVIFPIIGLNMLVTVFLAVIVYREKITPLRLLALILSVIAILFLRQ
ncbi:MAG: DMT family transporter [archaeon]